MQNTRGLIDTHAHVIDPARFPLGSGGYQPRADEVGTAEEFSAVLAAHGAIGAVLVQPSGYGFDNRAMLDAMDGHIKGVAVIAPGTSDSEIATLAASGVVGARFNLTSYDPQALERPGAERLLAQIKSAGWFAQVFGADAHWVRAAPILRRAGVKVLVDHFGVSDASAGLQQPGFQAVLALGRDGVAAIKLSAPYRIGGAAELRPFAEAVIGAYGLDSCVWGSDWPFLGVWPKPTYAEQIAALSQWLPDPDDRDRVLRRTPARLFDFGDAS